VIAPSAPPATPAPGDIPTGTNTGTIHGPEAPDTPTRRSVGVAIGTAIAPAAATADVEAPGPPPATREAAIRSDPIGRLRPGWPLATAGRAAASVATPPASDGDAPGTILQGREGLPPGDVSVQQAAMGSRIGPDGAPARGAAATSRELRIDGTRGAGRTDPLRTDTVAVEPPARIEVPGANAPRPEPGASPQALPPGIAERVRALADRLTQVDGSDRAGPILTELELAPKELGRLKMVLQATERGLHLQIFAERPETLDLVRRHVDALHRAMVMDGVTLAGLELGSEGGRGSTAFRDGRGEGATPQAPLEPTDETAPELPRGGPRPDPRGPLDLRL
jgi:hypothetical protein